MWWLVLLITVLAWYVIGNQRYKLLVIIAKTLPRDIKMIKALAKVLYFTIIYRNESIPGHFQKTVKKHPKKIAICFEDETWTFQQLDEFSNRVASYFKNLGLQKDDTVALILENRPEYVGLWLGLAKIRVTVALINTNLVSKPLLHSINVANAKTVIFGSDFENAVSGIKDDIEGIKLYRFTTSNVTPSLDAVDLKNELKYAANVVPTSDILKIKSKDKFLYIYTSGTTGLPKAAIISHSRFHFIVTAYRFGASLKSEDIHYNCLPLYHSAGGMLALGQTLVFGITNVIRRKFSASNFWKDCVKYKCTVAVYIGELCRYLLAAHDGKKIEHNIRMMAGNGLKKEIWKKFVDTFNINEIYEFYGSTEGNANMVNFDGKCGAVGCIPIWAGPLSPFFLIKCDEDTKEPIRDERGFCVLCKNNEPGILIGKINKKFSLSEFDGYADKKETGKKILKNVFKKGDAYFHSGDLLVRDELGYFYFKDRTGDTYRWKGENVATTEVEKVVAEIVGLKDNVVYGVQVPNNDGKAGMIAIVDPDNTIDLKTLAKGLKQNLPNYAIPLFLRILDKLPLTSTFKVKKNELQKEGFDVNSMKDPLYFYDLKNIDYVDLRTVYDDIVSGKLRL